MPVIMGNDGAVGNVYVGSSAVGVADVSNSFNNSGNVDNSGNTDKVLITPATINLNGGVVALSSAQGIAPGRVVLLTRGNVSFSNSANASNSFNNSGNVSNSFNNSGNVSNSFNNSGNVSNSAGNYSEGNGRWWILTIEDGQTDLSLTKVANTAVVAYGDGNHMFLSNVGNAVVADKATNLSLEVIGQTGTLTMLDFGNDVGGTIHLTDTQYANTAQALTALTPDGSGGVMLPLGAGGRIDFVGESSQQVAGHISVGQ